MKELYGIEVATGAISAITDKIIPVVKEWQQRPLDSHYPFVWLDAIHYKIRDNGRYETKAVYTITINFTTDRRRRSTESTSYIANGAIGGNER